MFIPRINALLFKDKILTNGSFPIKLLCDDGCDYIVKYPIAGTKTLINEFISWQLAKKLNIPVPECALVDINRAIFPSQIIFERGTPNGLGFGSRFLNGIVTNLDESIELPLRTAGLARSILSIILFDIWLRNDDRSINNPNILIQELSAKINFYAIDHAAVFGQAPYARLEDEKRILPSIEDTLLQHPLFLGIQDILKESSAGIAEEICEKIMNFPRENINEIVYSVPGEWELNNIAKEQIIDFINIEKVL